MAKPIIAPGDVPPSLTWNEWFVNVNWARQTTVQSVLNSVTLVTASDLVIPCAANAIYEMRAVITYAAPTAADMKVLFRTPTSATFQGAGTVLIAGAASQTEIQTLPYGGNASEVWGGLGGGSTWGFVQGVLITAGTAGNFSVEFAQNVANSGGSTSINVNSHMSLRRMS